MSLLLLVVTRNREVSARKLKKLGEFWNGVVPEICGGVVGVYPKKRRSMSRFFNTSSKLQMSFFN